MVYKCRSKTFSVPQRTEVNPPPAPTPIGLKNSHQDFIRCRKKGTTTTNNVEDFLFTPGVKHTKRGIGLEGHGPMKNLKNAGRSEMGALTEWNSPLYKDPLYVENEQVGHVSENWPSGAWSCSSLGHGQMERCWVAQQTDEGPPKCGPPEHTWLYLYHYSDI